MMEKREVIVANRIGLLIQSHDATAGLIGNTLVALERHPDTRERVAADPDLLPAVLLEVLRHDPPVQNTRRFVARDGVVAGQEMREGDAVLVLLAAANRDPAANPGPSASTPSARRGGFSPSAPESTPARATRSPSPSPARESSGCSWPASTSSASPPP